MSDWPQGPGWWQASDSTWYAPDRRPAPTEPVPRRGARPAMVVASLVVALVLATSVAAIVLREDGGVRLAVPPKDFDVRDKDDVDAPDGYKIVGGGEAGFTMAIPDRYESFDLTAEDLEDVVDYLAPDNPELAEMLEASASALERGGRLMAFDVTTIAAGDLADNVQVVERPAFADPTSAVAQAQAMTGLESVGASVRNAEVIDLVAGEALRIDFTIPLNLPGGDGGDTIEVNGRMVVLKVGGDLWNITYTTGPDTGDEDFEVMLDSFRVTD